MVKIPIFEMKTLFCGHQIIAREILKNIQKYNKNTPSPRDHSLDCLQETTKKRHEKERFFLKKVCYIHSVEEICVLLISHDYI